MAYCDVPGIVPPLLGCLHVNLGWLDFLDEFLGPVGQSSRGVCCSDQENLSVRFRIFQDGQSVAEGVEAVPNAIVNGAVDIGLSKEAVHNFSGHE